MNKCLAYRSRRFTFSLILAFFTAMLAVSLLSLAGYFVVPSPVGAQEVEAYREPQKTAAPCDLYYNRTYVDYYGNRVAMRWGEHLGNHQGFGVRHIAKQHNGWSTYKDEAIKWVLKANPRYSYDANTRKIVTYGHYRAKPWKIVHTFSKGRCPGTKYGTGVITAHRVSKIPPRR
jgi:hypothetical protein